MKAALVVNRIKSSWEENLSDILNYIKKAAEQDADLIVLPEAAVTGLNLTDDPSSDIQLGLTVEGQQIIRICNSAKNNKINVAIGILEKDIDKLYDTALFINRNGEIALKYRRISMGWRDSAQDTIYKEGTEVKVLDSEFGRISFLICGDLFDDKLVNKVAQANLDYLIFPFARCFWDGVNVKAQWQKETFNEYLERMKKTNAIVLAANYVDEEYFGGAFAVDRVGKVISYLEIQQEGMLIVNA